ncbi:MAG TPA: translocation/assembly module TamB domain-containing protein [Acetobacteraceae bacterium]|nr:translocation/assembly module TamB domain-containing protein [Acetobacteraceae bacterium]
MRRAAKWLAWILLALIGVPILLVVVVLVGANLGPGRDLLVRLTPSLTGGQVAIAGLAGRFPDALRVGTVELRDTKGAYLTLHNVVLDWSPLRLVRRVVDIDQLTAANGVLARQPAPSSSTSSSSGLPVKLVLHHLKLDRLELAPAAVGVPAALALEGAGTLDSYTTGQGRLLVTRVDSPGSYRLDASVDDARMHLTVQVDEPPHGLIAAVAQLPDLGGITVNAALDGPRNAVATRLAITAGPLQANAQGSLDLVHNAADLTIAAHAPAMTPRPDVSWQAIALDARVQGPFARPNLNGRLQLDQVSSAGAGVQRLVADVAGDQGLVRVHATAEGVRVPGSPPDLFAAAPFTLDATAHLEAPGRPVEFALQHPLLTADGSAETAGAPQAKVHLVIPQLAPFAAVAGTTLEGHTTLDLSGGMQDGATQLAVTGTIGLDSGAPPAPALLGNNAGIDLLVSMRGQELTITRFALNGRDAGATAHGVAGANKVDLDWSVQLSDLSAVQPTLKGRIAAGGHVGGNPKDLSVVVDLNGEVATRDISPGGITAHLEAQGLPTAPNGRLTAQGTLLGSPLELAVAAQRQADGTMHVSIDRADWKSAHAEGAVTLTPPNVVPEGRITFAMTRLADLAPLVGKPVSGSIEAALDATPSEAKLAVTVRDAGIPGTASVSRVNLNMAVADPARHPVVDGTLSLDRLSAGKLGASGTLQARGPLDALAIRLAATVPALSGAPARLNTSATVNVPQRGVTLSALQAEWKQLTLRLLAPAHIDAANGVAVDHMRLGLQQAVLAVSGKAGDTLDLTASLRDLPADIASVISPQFAANGTISADARLTGTSARPDGTLRLNARGVQLRSGPGRAVPPANLTAEATLTGGVARVDTRLTAGSSNLTVSGTAPVTAGNALDLRSAGVVDLGMIEPIMAASGRRVAGRISLDARITGTKTAPRIAGTAQLTGGEVQDYQAGFNLRAIAATIQADGAQIRLAHFSAQAGPGTISGSGTIGLAAPMPINLTFTAQNATPVANEMLTERLDANLAIAGDVQGNMNVQGTVRVRRADLQIPDKLPQSVAVLPVRNANAPPQQPAKAAPAPDIALNLTVQVDQLLVAGHGLDAELAGAIQVHGTAANPQPTGGLRLQRGTFALLGQTLTFSEGSVDFIGAGISDPALHFVANTTSNNIVATLTVGGTARQPKITLSSVPDMPQDEILAQILFHRSTAELSPIEIAQIAAALASFTGAVSNDPLANLSKSLGLDRLSVGSNNAGAATVQAGKYVAPGLYLGAKQSASGGTQAALQYDITKGLKLETTAGMGGGNPQGSNDSGGSSVGLTYQFEY